MFVRTDHLHPALAWLVVFISLSLVSAPTVAQSSPELAMRDFSSGQIKKGVRSIGFGGDGASWGSYGLVWRDAGTALYLIAMTEGTNDLQLKLKSPGFGPAPTPVSGHGTDDALFSKIALPLGHGVSI